MQKPETTSYSKQLFSFPNIFVHKLSKTEFQNAEFDIPFDNDELSVLSESEFGKNFNMNDDFCFIEHSGQLNLFSLDRSTKSDFNSAFSNTFTNKSNEEEKEDYDNEVHIIKKKSREIRDKTNESTNDLLNKKVKRNQRDLFYVDNGNDKFGNNLKDVSGRKDNLKSKIKRHFIQNILFKWIINREPEKKEKLKSKKLQEYIKSFKNHKDKKLSEIYNIPEIQIDETIKIKLNFTLEQAFKCFSNTKEERKSILSSILEESQSSIKIDEETFFSGLNKLKYFNWLIKNGSAQNKVYQVFDKIANEFGDSEFL